jgi:pterin-4a-carbinolamine dehydratase
VPGSTAAAETPCSRVLGVRSSEPSFKALDSAARRPIDTPVTTLEGRQLRRALMQAPGWRLHDGALVRELALRDFDEALAVLERVASCAVDYGRRPDMCISEFNRVRLSISNPHNAGLTAAELRLAAKVDGVLDEG